MKFCGILRICLLLLWGTFHSGAFQIASSQQVHTYVDADSVEVGQIIHYSIVLESNSDEAVYPDGTEFEDPLEFISRQRFQVTATRDSLVYRMQFFGTENRSEEHTSELQSRGHLVCRLLLEKKNNSNVD